MSTPRMVTLDRDTMSGYLLNVLGTDQIHDFGGSQLEGAKKNIVKIFSNATSLNNSKLKYYGGYPVIIDLPTDSEFIEQQCLEIINIFVNTIIEDNTTNDPVNNTDNLLSDEIIIIGGRDLQESTVSLDTEPEYINTSSPDNGKSQKSVSSLVKPMDIGKVTEDTINSNPVSDDTESEPIYDNLDNVMEWGKHVKSKIDYFINMVPNNINDSLNYICIDDIINIFTSYLGKLSNISTPEHVINFEYFNTLYIESMNYFISPMLISCSNNIQRGGNTKTINPLKSTISTMIKQMAFTFCNISDDYNCGDWKNSPNWKCFEIGLLNNNISTVESASSEWIRNQIFPNKSIKQQDNEPQNKKSRIESNTSNVFLSYIQPLKDLIDFNGNLNCNLNPKTLNKHIIVNSANLKNDWKPFILNNYPSYIDSQPSGGKENELLEKMDKYNCGFKDPSGNDFYKIIMNTISNKHTISIRSNNQTFTFNKKFSNFEIYNKITKQSVPAKKWKDVTLCVALINALNRMSSMLKNNKITSLQRLISSIKNNETQNFKFVNNQITDLTIINLFYSFSLFKGLGDISQEMTAVIKYGGGNKNIIRPKNTDNYEAFNSSGNALRFFLAGDRLSANRFILTLNSGLKTGNNNNINSKAYGGYLHVYGCKSKDMYLIEPKSITWGGNKKHSKKYKNSKRNRKNHTKNMRNKHNKTYKLYKKNRS